MPGVLEWIQCKACGRRQRWRADLAGKTIQCSCGADIYVPEVDLTGTGGGGGSSTGTGMGTGHETMVETADDRGAFDQSFLNPSKNGEAEYVPPRRMGKALFGLSVQGEFLFWSIMALLGLSMLIHAAITRFWWYIALAVLIAPLSFWQWRRAKRIWQGPRKFWKAVEQSLSSE
ncbi:MAG TPA: hypothetical protein VG797_02655 [Phycisphaerales bacterium]|nr:hypothetical protein [Phycisphaerales bacterium]